MTELPAPPPPERPGAVILLSGGTDSAIMAGVALETGEPIHPLFVRQGLIWEDAEERVTRRYLAALSRMFPGLVAPLAVATLSLPADMPVDWAVKADAPLLGIDEPDETVFLPGRNLALLTQAALLAYTAGVRRIQLGILSGNPFPDASGTFFRAFEEVAREAMRWAVHVETPFRRLTKAEVIERGAHFPLELTISCNRPVDDMHCGLCNKCEERRVAFKRAGIKDPAPFAIMMADR